ncbi:MAG: glycoside hydrolase family 30 beta sandwich domain-containing protein [Saprospiraceae bacterium]
MHNAFNISLLISLVSCLCVIGCSTEDAPTLQVENAATQADTATVFQILTSADRSRLLEESTTLVEWTTGAQPNLPTITIDPSATHQTMNGFGYTLNGGSAILLSQMSTSTRADLLQEMFGRGENESGVNYLRLSVGASDLDPEVFSYNDVPAGQTDVNLMCFSIWKEKEFLLPILEEILAIAPDIKIMGSPWSPPIWMKDNGSSIGGSLQPQYYEVYANYLVKYVEAMADEGVRIDALTVQNEPLYPGNNPSLLMLAEDQKTFVRDFLGPAFASTTLGTKLIIYDHNCDKPEYPITILDDAEAKAFVDGSAFHLYDGDISELSTVHNAHPDKHLYFTEQYTNINGDFSGDFMWHVKNMHIGAPRNWSRNVLEWNLASDPTASIHTPGGCTECLGAITVDGDSIYRNAAYYAVAHSSKWVLDGSTRISSTQPNGLNNVTYLTPFGKTVLLAINEGGSLKAFQVTVNQQTIQLELPARTVGTYKF